MEPTRAAVLPSGPDEFSARPEPSLYRLMPSFVRISLVGLFVLAIFYTLYLGAEFFIPVVAALLLNLVLSPIPNFLKRFHIPTPFSAGLIVLMLSAAIIGAFYSLSEPVSEWMLRVPEISNEIENKIDVIRKPIEDVKKASEEVEKIADVEGESDSGTEVVVKPPSLLKKLLGSLRSISVQLGFVLVLLYFLLAVGDLFRRNLIRVTPRLKDKLRAERIVRDVEQEIGSYLLTITIINIGLGVAVGLALYAVGLPNALLWGLMAGLLNYVPYIGAVVGIGIIAVVSLISFDSLGDAMTAPLLYVALNTLESQIITPSILSQRLTLNPVITFVAVTFWSWFWGIPGALMAVPLLVIFKILCDHIEIMKPIGELIGGEKSVAPIPADRVT